MENSTLEIIKIALPVIVLQLIIQIYAIIDVARKKKTRNLSVPIWLVIIILGELVGAIVYFIIGRAEEE